MPIPTAIKARLRAQSKELRRLRRAIKTLDKQLTALVYELYLQLGDANDRDQHNPPRRAIDTLTGRMGRTINAVMPKAS